MVHFPLWTAPGVGMCPQQLWELEASSIQHLRVELKEMLHCPASTEEVKACLCHSDHVPKILLQKYSSRQQTEPALEGSPSLCPWVGGRALFLVALPHTTDTAQPHRWLCHLSIHVKNHSTRGPTQPSVALTCVITGSTQPFFLNYFQLPQDKCRKKSWTAFKMIM